MLSTGSNKAECVTKRDARCHSALVKVCFVSPQVVYSTTASVPKVETVKPANNKDDDIDIDAI